MAVDDIASDLMLGEQPDYGSHPADRAGSGPKWWTAPAPVAVIGGSTLLRDGVGAAPIVCNPHI